MVFAVIALILQFAAVPKLVFDGKANASAIRTSAVIAVNSSTDNSSENDHTKSGKHATPPSIQPNFSHVRLANDPTESSSTDKLTALSLEISENSGSLSSVRIPSAQPIKPVEVKTVEKRRPTRSWWALTITMHGAAGFDAYSTRQAVSRGAVEVDPLMRPFAHSSAIYVASQVGPVVLDLISRKMMPSENPVFRGMWGIPQSTSTAMFIFSGVHNLGVASRQ